MSRSSPLPFAWPRGSQDIDPGLIGRAVDALEGAERAPCPSWQMHYLRMSPSLEQEALVFSAPRIDVHAMEDFIASATLRMLAFFGYSRKEIRALLASSQARALMPAPALAHWPELPHDATPGAQAALISIRSAYPLLEQFLRLDGLGHSTRAELIIARNDCSYVAMYRSAMD